MAILIRPERPDDADAIDAVLRAAFGSPGAEVAEAILVRALRADRDLALSLVAQQSAAVVGHIAFVPIEIEPDPLMRIWALAPLAVLPDQQKRGIGAALIREGLDRARQAGVGLVLVLGNPAYYCRFGFAPENATTIGVNWAGPHFMGLILRDARPPRGKALYPAAFATL